MGVPTKTQVEAWSDHAAAVIQKDLTGFGTETAGKSSASLWDQVDLSGDASVENALLASALAVDAMSLPENYPTALQAILARSPLGDWVRALAGQVTSTAGGSYASFRAYLADKTATVHPLFGELVRYVLGESALTDSDGDITTVFAPAYSSRSPLRVWVGADGSLSEETTDADDVGTADVTLFGSDDHTLYVGSPYKFSRVIVGLSTLANASVVPTFQYWNGSAWATLTVTDNTTGFTKNDVITFTAPADWGRCYKDGGGTAFSASAQERLYYVRIARTENTVGTPPVGTCIRIVPAAVPVTTGGTTHYGVDQPALALVRITGANTCSVESLNSVDWTRFKEPSIRLRALTPFANDLTFTVAYTDQAGNTGNTQAQSAWTAPAALATVAVTLAGVDTGVRTIATTGWAVTTNATEGIVEVYVAESRTPAI